MIRGFISDFFYYFSTFFFALFRKRSKSIRRVVAVQYSCRQICITVQFFPSISDVSGAFCDYFPYQGILQSSLSLSACVCSWKKSCSGDKSGGSHADHYFAISHECV